MSKLLNKVVKIKEGRYNTNIGEGISRKMLPEAPKYLDAVIKAGMESIPKDLGFTYKGWRYLSPKEDYYQHENSSNGRTFDIAKSTLYKVEYLFDFRGEEIKRVIALPYVERGGLLYLSDAVYSVVPVLTEYIISANNKEVFVRLLKDKLIFKKMEKPFLVNGNKTPLPIIYAHLYKFKSDLVTKIPIPIMLFVKHGVDGVMRRYFNMDPKDFIITDQDVSKEELTKEGRVVFESLGKKPRGLKDDNYKPHNLKIIVPKDKVDFFMENTIASLLYTWDLINIFGKNILKVRGTKDEAKYWKVILGKLIFKNKYTIDKILTDMDEYLNVLNTYVDFIIKEKLEENNIYVEDYYDLLAYIAKNFNQLIMGYEERSTSLDTRYIDVNYYILYELIENINKSIHKIIKDSKIKNLSKKDIERIFNSRFSTRKIFGLIKQGVVLALVPVDYSGDNFFTKVLSPLEDQNRGNGVKRHKDNAFPPATRSLHAVDLYIGNLLYLSKKAPSPRFKINPMLRIDYKTGRILVDEQDKLTMDKLSKLIEGKFEDDSIEILDNTEDIDF